VIWHKRLKNWAQNWILCHDSVLCHIFLAVQPFVLKNQIPALLEIHSGHYFLSVREIQQHTTAFLAHVPKELFQRSLQQWLECWSKCVFVEEKYFEGDYFKSLLPQTMPEFWGLSDAPTYISPYTICIFLTLSVLSCGRGCSHSTDFLWCCLFCIWDFGPIRPYLMTPT